MAFNTSYSISCSNIGLREKRLDGLTVRPFFMSRRQEMKKRIVTAMKELLKSRGQDNPVNLCLADDYGDLYDLKEALKKEIKETGVAVPYREMEDGTILYKKNDRIAELNKVIAQMSKITYDLGIRACDMDIKDLPIEL